MGTQYFIIYKGLLKIFSISHTNTQKKSLYSHTRVVKATKMYLFCPYLYKIKKTNVLLKHENKSSQKVKEFKVSSTDFDSSEVKVKCDTN